MVDVMVDKPYKLSVPDDAVEIVTDFIKSYVIKSGKKGGVIGLSGGIDSAVVAVLAKNGLGEENIQFLILPDSNSQENDIKDAMAIAGNSPCKIIEIDSIVSALTRELKIDEGDKILIGNIKARTRMIILYSYASMLNYLVIGTGNKSELLTGYFTKYGDGGADLLPIGDLYKTEVFEIAKKINIPVNIINKAPTAGLWPGQKDEEELGIDYRSLDMILYGLEHLDSISDISRKAGVDLDTVKKIQEMVMRSWHKRNLPPVLKLSYRTVGVDWYD